MDGEGVRNLLLERQHDMKYETEEETKKVVGGKSATQKPTTQRQKDTEKVAGKTLLLKR